MIEIRNARSGDAPALVSLLEALGYPGTADFIESRIAQLLIHPDEVLLVACSGDSVTGFISLHFIPQLALAGDFCRISYFCISEQARSQGVGALLEARAVELAKARGCDRIELHCHSRRTGAHQFYPRQGYIDSPTYFYKPLTSA